MARKSQLVQVGKRKIELSNLTKTLFPDLTISKAEVIQYYLTLAPTILAYIKGRPLSLVRFPDGIEGETFFQKNRPDWAPEWMEYVTLGSDKKKDYMMATEEASLVWLANLACVEMHQLHSCRPNFSCPNYIVYDIDPPEGYDFTKVVEIAIALKEHIEKYGYHVFVKTTGGKGVHLLTPILPKWSFKEVFEVAKKITQPFVEKQPDTTLHIKKESRKGRVLIDIYRNRSGQSIIGAYSLRGRPQAPVSMPVTWQKLRSVQDPNEFNIRTALGLIESEGDPWEGFGAYAIGLHTESKIHTKATELPESSKYKTEKQLKEYGKKRDFSKTPEPKDLYEGGDSTGFVIHRHHASHLHYDLRLEENGVLKSWAVPRGMPPKPGIKRLAVSTEDHPMKYLTFEGQIPKGQYGGGNMWIYANGKYEITKQKKDGFYFKLTSPQITAEYRMHQMEGKEWLLERVDRPQKDWLSETVNPMLAGASREVPTGDYAYEVKWDGIRAFVSYDEGEINIWSRNHKKLNDQFPELINERAFRINSGLFDAEIVCFDQNSKPDFKSVIHRMNQKGDMQIQSASSRKPAFCYLFDCLYLDGRTITQEPLSRRKEWLKDSIRKETAFRISETVEEGTELFEAAKSMGLEGIMAKLKTGKYYPGKRSDNWIKVKVRNASDAIIIGYTNGNGEREPYFGALHLANEVDGKWLYRGKVGTGFTMADMKEIKTELSELEEVERMIDEKPLDNKQTTWLNPQVTCEVEYASITKNGTFREPVFLRLRTDL